MPDIRFIDAIGQALADELDADPAVAILGEDVTVGGPFGATRGLVDRFGPWRVRNTPISEATVMGLATGAALTGLRPVVEVMFIDFATLAMDQLVNHAAKLRYMSGGVLAVPLTVRASFGVSGGYGAHHSQSLEAWFAHVPGLRVWAPSTPRDAYTGLRAAIRSDDPVLFLEHRALYFTRGPSAAPGEHERDDQLRARIVRAGRDVTVVSWGRTVHTVLEAAEALSRDGIDVEVIDARSLSPLDLETMAASVGRTHHVAVVHEAVTTGGLGAEVAAALGAAAFDDLDAPILRIGAPFAPPPASPSLEAVFVPSAERIAAELRVLVDAIPGTATR